MYKFKFLIVLFTTFFSANAIPQSRPIADMTIGEIGEELDQIILREFEAAGDEHWEWVILHRLQQSLSTAPELFANLIDISLVKASTIESVLSAAINDPRRVGDNRILTMCRTWNNSTYIGIDRIDEALLSYERENSAGYSDFVFAKVDRVLSAIQESLDDDEFERFSSFIDDELDLKRGKLTISSFTRMVRSRQDFATMEYHCELSD